MFCRVNFCQPFLPKCWLKQSSGTLFWSFVFDLWKENHHPVLTQSILRHLASSYFGHNGHMCFLFIWAAAADALWAVSMRLELVIHCGGWKCTYMPRQKIKVTFHMQWAVGCSSVPYSSWETQIHIIKYKFQNAADTDVDNKCWVMAFAMSSSHSLCKKWHIMGSNWCALYSPNLFYFWIILQSQISEIHK